MLALACGDTLRRFGLRVQRGGVLSSRDSERRRVATRSGHGVLDHAGLDLLDLGLVERIAVGFEDHLPDLSSDGLT